MSVPNTLFLDTSIFDEQNYNFESAVVRPFLSAVEGKNLNLLLPDPTSREINRHIAQRADAVVTTLEDARRKAPFLAKFKEWPRLASFALSWQLRQLAVEEWNAFLCHFNLRRLSFEGVNLMEIMAWYDNQHPPFGPKKRKEFPDALALASILAFVRKERTSVAVVSRDADFKHACDRFAELLYFPSLPAFTEALIASDERVDKVKRMLQDDVSMLEDGIREEFLSLSFFPSANPEGTVDLVKVSEMELSEVHVVGLGDGECTVAFEASVRYRAHVEFDDLDSAIVDSSEGIFMPLHRHSGFVADSSVVSGVAKIEIKDAWTRFGGVLHIHLEQMEIEVNESPEQQPID
jgi:PIN domain-containing protein